MKFQTLLSHKANTSILVNRKTLKIDAFGCVDVTDPEDIELLQGMPKEWSAEIKTVSARGGLAPAARNKTAAELVEDVGNDENLRQKLVGMRSAITRRSWLEAQGYRFTDADLTRALEMATPPPPPAAQPVPATPPATKAPTRRAATKAPARRAAQV